jgi:hypothetical protein
LREAGKGSGFSEKGSDFWEINKENLILLLTSEDIKNMAGYIPEQKGAI